MSTNIVDFTVEIYYNEFIKACFIQNKRIVRMKRGFIMALIRCNECSAEISDKAKFCPKCGAPVIPHKWRCPKCGNMISEEPCYYCNKELTVVKSNIDANAENDLQTVKQNNKNNNGIKGIVSLFIALALILAPFYSDWFGSSYYVAKLPSYSAGSVKVDGYLHKSKSCCQKVANAFGAEVVRVNSNKSAGTNSYGQTIKYKDCFNYCPLCCD